MDGGVVVAYVVSYLLGGLTRLVDRELDDGLTRLFNAVKSKVQGKPAWCALANAPTDDGRQRQLREVVDSVAQDDPRWAAEVAEPKPAWIVETPARSTSTRPDRTTSSSASTKASSSGTAWWS